jgi:Zn-finger nucleic acid-binding protein
MKLVKTQKNVEARLPCPVCLGVMMQKVVIGENDRHGDRLLVPVTLDSCARCGGIWFQHGEVQLLRRMEPKALWATVLPRDRPHVAQCHACHAPIERIHEKCPACEAKVTLQCPECVREMSIETHAGLRLDLCRHCKGVWFDHTELASIWNLQLDAAAQRHHIGAAGVDAGGDVAWTLLHVLAWSPDLAIGAGYAAGAAVRGAGELISAAPEAVAAAGEAAAGLFETIVEIIAGIFG